MNSSNLTQRDIFKLVEEGKLSADEAFKMIKKLPAAEEGEPVHYYEPLWQEESLTSTAKQRALEGTILLFSGSQHLQNEIKAKTALEVILVSPGEGFIKLDENSYRVNPISAEDYSLLFQELAARKRRVDKIVQCWSEESPEFSGESLDKELKLSLFSLLYITKELQKLKQKGDIRLLYLYSAKDSHPSYGAIGGFNRTVKAERLNYHYSSLRLKDREIATSAELIINELKAVDDSLEITYEKEKRLVKRYSPLTLPAEVDKQLLKADGVYLITGGLGGLGLIFAEYLARNCSGKIILSGRSRLDEKRRKRLEELNSYSSEVIYLKADISKTEDLEKLLAEIRSRFDKIDGIIHSAGINRDSYILNKTISEVEEVIAPKIFGTVELDRLTASDKLDFFILFSALAAAIGNAGQADYTYANSFMDYYVDLREKLRSQGERSGKTLAISWPLWKEGGMRVDSAVEKQFRQSWGMSPLRTEEGIKALFKGLAWNGKNLLVIEGDKSKIDVVLGIKKKDTTRAQAIVDSDKSPHNLTVVLQNDLVQLISTMLNIKARDLDPEDEFNDYGFDSITFTTLANNLNERYKSDFTPTIFFEYTTINDFIEHFAEGYPQLLQHYYGDRIESRAHEEKRVSPIVEHTREVRESHSPDHIKSALLKMVSSILGVREEEIDFEDELHDYGFDSIKLTELANRINSEYDLELTPAIFFEHSTLEDFAKHLFTKLELKTTVDELNEINSAYNLQNELKEIVSDILGVEKSEIDPEDELNDYGFDSIKLTDFANKINNKYSLDITPALFFEYTTLELISDHLEQEHEEQFSKLYGKTVPVSPHKIDRFEEELSLKPEHREKTKLLRTQEWADSSDSEGVAIIGINGIFPGSSAPAEFWTNLEAGLDLVKEIPPERWRWQDYLDNGSDRETSRWGGFIDDIDRFDPLFFKISPQEAEQMDPQQRIFLQTVWRTIEDAGYKPSSLSGSKTGLFLGMATNDYSELMVQAGTEIEAQTAIGTQHSIVANRISYLLNLRGPSIPVDTACASSLVAIHYAVESIKNGSCEMAIAGGVNALLSPRLFISFSKSGMMSPVGRCKTFDDSAGGYVRGEGVGAVLLKPLRKALEDGDFIYATIKATAVNHGGHAKSLTAPNPNAQAELLIEAYSKAGIDPATVTYIETHGTGTPLGDPIEINGLKKAFKELYKKWGREPSGAKHCALSSVKTNIGHLESAAGIAGLIKVLLAMRHKQLPKTVHFTKQNRYIQLEDSPFYITDKLTPWKTGEDDYGLTIPRRAGVSSFGFGGVNAHIVVEEHHFESDVDNQRVSRPQLIVISAADEGRLKAYVKEMVKFINEYKNRHYHIDEKILLANIAYTLQTGRDEMDYRLATVVTTIEELAEKLSSYLNGKGHIDELMAGHIKSKDNRIHLILKGELGRSTTRLLVDDGHYFGLAVAWVEGVELDWELLHEDFIPKRVPLPTYPFAKERYWLPEITNMTRVPAAQKATAKLHMMLDSNISTFQEQAFNKVFRNDEIYLRDHLLEQKHIVPGSALIELARAAGEQAAKRKVSSISALFGFAVEVGANGQEVKIVLSPTDNSRCEYQIMSLKQNGEQLTHAQGEISFAKISAKSYATTDLNQIKNKLELKQNPDELFKRLKEINVKTGVVPMGTVKVSEMYYDEREIISRLTLTVDQEDSILHPSMIDASIQTLLVWTTSKEKIRPHVFFSVEKIEIITPHGKACYSHSKLVSSRENKIKKFDTTLYDEKGNPLVIMKDITYKVVDFTTLGDTKSQEHSHYSIYYKPIWKVKKLIPDTLTDDRPLIIFDQNEDFYNQVQSRIKILVKPSNGFQKNGEDRYQLNLRNLEDFRKLLSSLNERELDNPAIVYFSNCSTDNIAQGVENDLQAVFNLTRALFDEKIKKGSLIYINTEQELPADGTLTGLCKTVMQENPNYRYKTLSINRDILSPEIVQQELIKFYDLEVRYVDEKREIKTVTEVIPAPLTSLPLKKGGLYLITGGTGGLGFLFARYLVEKYRASLILSGRSPLDEKRAKLVEELNKGGAKVTYLQSDVSNYASTAKLISQIKSEFGQLNGIIHAAGLLKDSYIIKKDRENFKKVLAPKITGTVNLDETTKDIPLDLFILFSSTAAVTGNAGQADYAAANCFLDHFSVYRNSLVKTNLRSGRTISINWPLWREGGMQIDSAFEEQLARTQGMKVLETERGLEAFEDILQMDESQLIVFEGEPEKVKRVLGIESLPIIKEETKSISPVRATGELHEEAKRYLRELFTSQLKLPAQKINDKAEFEKYGIDSILIMKLNSIIEKDFANLPKTLFFEYNTIEELAGYFAENHSRELEKLTTVEPAQTLSRVKVEKTVTLDEKDLTGKIEKYLKELFAKSTKLPPEKINRSSAFEKYGIDSILIMKLNSLIEEDFGSLPKTLFFEYNTIEELGRYFIENHKESLSKLFAEERQSESKEYTLSVKESQFKSRFLPSSPETDYSHDKTKEREGVIKDIAVIGINGRFPQAENLEQFWQALKEGKDCITEIPPERWDYRDYFDKDKSKKGMSYSKWGGFLKEIDKFDPLFFSISPREAEMMDPQERIFLETAWSCLEDAGYTPASLKEKSPIVGVFAGAMWTDYQLYKANGPEFSKDFHPGSYLCYIPNRVSYTFGFTGPSVAMDTACSSSLTALHMACQSIINGECDAALAGGVNTISHPNRYQIYSYLGFASSEGKCRTFGENGDGYVAGEGSGIVLLKGLDRAIEDGDHIYGIIKGSAINHGGKVSGLTVPNPNQQAAVISTALKRSGIDPRTISYLEAHGTGTSLGDPIEIRGLSKAYSEYTPNRQYCPIGSSKSNIGHLEAAAGIAQVIKVMLQLKHQKLVPSLHSETLNPNIDFANSPFYVQHKYEKWQKPVIDGISYPRRAGISSFGAGGSNAHIIIEEYEQPPQAEDIAKENRYLALLSAKREPQLKEAAVKLLSFLEANKKLSLRDICYTLQKGREAMPHRLAVQTSTVEELTKGLRSYIEEIEDNSLSSGTISPDSTPQENTDITTLLNESNLTAIAEYWLSGGQVEWSRLYQSPLPQRLPLPTYPFQKKSYWIPGEQHLGDREEKSNIDIILNKLKSGELDVDEADKLLEGEDYV